MMTTSPIDQFPAHQTGVPCGICPPAPWELTREDLRSEVEASGGNRTLAIGMEVRGSTIELQAQVRAYRSRFRPLLKYPQQVRGVGFLRLRSLRPAVPYGFIAGRRFQRVHFSRLSIATSALDVLTPAEILLLRQESNLQHMD